MRMRILLRLLVVGLALVATPAAGLAQQQELRSNVEEAGLGIVMGLGVMLLGGLLIHGVEWLWGDWQKRRR